MSEETHRDASPPPDVGIMGEAPERMAEEAFPGGLAMMALYALVVSI